MLNKCMHLIKENMNQLATLIHIYIWIYINSMRSIYKLFDRRIKMISTHINHNITFITDTCDVNGNTGQVLVLNCDFKNRCKPINPSNL